MSIQRFKSIAIIPGEDGMKHDIIDIMTGERQVVTDEEYDELAKETVTKEEYEKSLEEYPIDPELIMQEVDGR